MTIADLALAVVAALLCVAAGYWAGKADEREEQQ